MRVMLVDCKRCKNSVERYRCYQCGLTGPEIRDLQDSTPATLEYLQEKFPNWTGKGAIYQ